VAGYYFLNTAGAARMQVTTQSTTRARLQADFDLKEQVREEVDARLDEKIRLSLLPGSTSPWPEARDYAEYGDARRDYAAASEVLSEHCRRFRT
jgi:hypothetical protein